MRFLSHTIAFLGLLPLILPSAKGQVDSSENWNTYDAYQKKIKGQERAPQQVESGRVRVHQPTLMDSLLARYRRFNREYSKLQGYRVQLFFGEREKAQKMKADFEEEYEDVKAYIDYLAPNFRLRVGDFRTRIDAYRFMQKLGSKFGRPYIVRTKIESPELSIEKKEAE